MVLRRGSRGNNVKTLQILLRNAGYDIAIDGHFGYGTRAVVKAFQADNNLKVDGVYGPNSKRVLSTKPRMKYQEYWKDRQTQVIKMRLPLTTCDVIDVKGMSVKSLWKSLKRKPKVLINGGLFNMKSGEDLNKMVDEGKHSPYSFYSKRGLKVAYDRSISFGEYDGDRDFLGGSPLLILDGKKIFEYPDLDHGFIHYKHPRLAIGCNDSYLYIVVVNGRNKWRRWYGCTLNQLRGIMYDLGCTNAMNLDGGGSISVVTKFGLFFKVGWRKVANMLAFYQ